MLQFLLRAIFVIFAIRLLFGLVRFLARLPRGRARGDQVGAGVGGMGVDGRRGPAVDGRRGPAVGGPTHSRSKDSPSIDRSAVIDVPFTEEDRHAKREASSASTAPGDGPGPR